MGQLSVGRYAEGTEVPSDRSRSEIERTLRRYGATAFAYAWEGDSAQIAFRLSSLHIRFRLPLPDPDSREFTLTPTGRQRTASAAEDAWEQAVRQRWRALALVIKAKLEAVESGISTASGTTTSTAPTMTTRMQLVWRGSRPQSTVLAGAIQKQIGASN